MVLMVVPFGTAPSAPQKAWGDDTGTITIAPPSGTAANEKTTYKIYKVFNASVGAGSTASYSLITSDQNGSYQYNSSNASYTVKAKSGVPTISAASGKEDTVPHFIADNADNVYYGIEQTTQPASVKYFSITKKGGTGTTYVVPVDTSNTNLTEEAVSAVKEYVMGDTPVMQVDATGTDNVTVTLPYGYYYVTTTSGSLVMIHSNNNVTIEDKNSLPTLDKTIQSVTSASESQVPTTDPKETYEGSVTTDGKAAIAQVGSKVWYQSEITVGKGATGYVYKDKMDDTLSLNADSVSVSYREGGSEATTKLASDTDYTLDTTARTSGDDQHTFKISFDKKTDAAKAALKAENTIIVSYSAIVQSNALSKDPAKNSATISWGDPDVKVYTSAPSTTSVYNAKVTVTKTDGSGQPLDGATFKISRDFGDTTKWYKYNEATDAQTASISWVDSENDGTAISPNKGDSDTTATATVLGLPDGTYNLRETSAPSGYNRAADRTITVASTNGKKSGMGSGEASESSGTVHGPLTTANLEQGVTVANYQGTTLPTTGGPGTIWLYVVGGVLVVAAGVALIARRRMRQH